MIDVLLQNHTSLAQQNRERLSHLTIIQLAIIQILIFTPNSALDAIQKSLNISQDPWQVAIYGGGIGAILAIITVGILHHICNLIYETASRMKYELRIMLNDRKENNNDNYRILDKIVVHKLSLSKSSGAIALILLFVLLFLTVVRFSSIFLYLFSDYDGAKYFLGIFYAIESGIIIFYFIVVRIRWKKFYIIRDLLREIESNPQKNEISNELKMYV